METLQDLVPRLAARGDRPAVLAFSAEGRNEISYGELCARSRALALGLRRTGLKQGEPVALFAVNGIGWVVCRLALILADALCVPVDYDADAARLRTLLKDSGARRVFTDAAYLTTAREAAAELSEEVEIVLLDRLADLEAAGQGGLPAARPEAPVSRFYTSGTTGPPRPVPLTHGNLLTNLGILLDLSLIGGDDRVLLPLPLHHSFPFLVGLLLPLACGATVVFPAGVSGPPLLRALRDGRVTALVGVPRLYEAMADAIDARIDAQGAAVAVLLRSLMKLSGALRRHFGLRLGRRLLAPIHRQLAPDLRLLASGGAHLKAEVAAWLEALGYEVLSGYGLVETTSVATFNLPMANRLGSAGRPSPGVEMRIQPVEGREHGEIQVRGPIVFSGYAGNAEANAAAFTADGWFRTGDLGWQDAEGFLFIAGRLKEMIVLSDGKNVAPEEVEAAYLEAPVVREVAVLEREDMLAAIVVPDLEAAKAMGGTLGDAVRVGLVAAGQRLPRYMRIADFVLTREALPRNPLGKLKRHLLPAILDRAGRGAGPSSRPLSEADRKRLATPRAQRLTAWLAKRFPDQRVDLDAALQMDLGLDSLAWVDLGLELERDFGVTLSEETVAMLTTVRDLVDAVEAPQGPVLAPPADHGRWLEPPGPTAHAAGIILYGLNRALCRLLFRVRRDGLAGLPGQRPLIIAANHVSDLDPAVLAAALPYRVLRETWWGADSRRVFGNSAGRALARVAQLFPVDDRAPAASIALAAEILERRGVVVWFPEEWRSPDGTLQAFRAGVGAVVARSGATVVPALIRGSFEAMPRTARLPRPHPVSIRLGAPITAEMLAQGLAGEEPHVVHRQIAARLREAVAALKAEDAFSRYPDPRETHAR